MGSRGRATSVLLLAVATPGCGNRASVGDDSTHDLGGGSSSDGPAATHSGGAGSRAQSDPLADPGAAATRGAGATHGDAPDMPAGASGAQPGGPPASGETGPCGHPVITFRVEAIAGTDVCAAPVFTYVGQDFGGSLSWLQTVSGDEDVVTFLPPEGLELVWGGQLRTYLETCSNGPAGECSSDAEIVCLVDAPDLQSAWPKNAAGQLTIGFRASPVSPRGTCTTDVMSIEVPFALERGGILAVEASEFAMAPLTGTYACGVETCDALTAYCEVQVQTDETGAERHGRLCREYPAECVTDHMCECLQPYLDEGVTCTDRGMAGITTVTDRTE